MKSLTNTELERILYFMEAKIVNLLNDCRNSCDEEERIAIMRKIDAIDLLLIDLNEEKRKQA